MRGKPGVLYKDTLEICLGLFIYISLWFIFCIISLLLQGTVENERFVIISRLHKRSPIYNPLHPQKPKGFSKKNTRVCFHCTAGRDAETLPLTLAVFGPAG